MNFQKPLPPAPMLPSRGQTTESGFVPVTPSWLSYSATHAPKILQNPRFYRQNDATATQHSRLFSQFCFCKCFSPTKVKERCKDCQFFWPLKFKNCQVCWPLKFKNCQVCWPFKFKTCQVLLPFSIFQSNPLLIDLQLIEKSGLKNQVGRTWFFVYFEFDLYTE